MFARELFADYPGWRPVIGSTVYVKGHGDPSRERGSRVGNGVPVCFLIRGIGLEILSRVLRCFFVLKVAVATSGQRAGLVVAGSDEPESTSR